MADFEKATTVNGAAEAGYAELDPAWCVWSPAGGYLMAIALRAAGRATGFSRPLSLSCHFLAAPALGEVELVVTSLRQTRVGESLRVCMQQGERRILEMLVWCGDEIDGYTHADAHAPEVPAHSDLSANRFPPATGGMHTLWHNLEQRPCGPLHWQRSEPAEPRQRDWIRLRDYSPPDSSDDAARNFLEAGRFALVLDCFTWPAAAHAHVGDPRFVAPTIAFSLELHQPLGSEWLLSDAHSPHAGRGCIAIHNRLWDDAGALVASASGTLICRPRPGR